MSRPLHAIKRRTASAAWLLAGLLLVLPVGQHAAAGLLVCFGADGHVDVEDGRWSDCAIGDIVDPHAPTPVAQQVPEDDCGDCVDVPLMVNPVEGRLAVVKSVVSVHDLHLAVTATVPLILPVNAREPVPAAPFSPAPPPSLAGLQTVVLLV